MILWRISNHQSLSGEGGLRVSARWHSRGRPVVYCADHPAGALLEVLVHFELAVGELPARYRLMKIDVPDDVNVERVAHDALPADWPERPAVTRAIGDAWLERGSSSLLSVPSAIVPEAFNVLLNPLHPDAARIVVVTVNEHLVDRRLLR